MSYSMGIDIGSTTLKIAGIDKNHNLMPVVIKYLFCEKPLYEILLDEYQSYTAFYDIPDNIGITGSGQKLGAYVLNTDLAATEIIAHAGGATFLAHLLHLPLPKTIIEIGGQDSKFIQLENGVPTFFNMNSICSAGTGEFLRHTIQELSMSFRDFNRLILKAKTYENMEDVCTVFARRSFRHAGQTGIPLDQRLKGLAVAIIKNYLRTVAKANTNELAYLKPPIYFLGGLSNCSGMALTLCELTNKAVYVPPFSQALGAIGMAYMASQNKIKRRSEKVSYNQGDLQAESGFCKGCVNHCELTVLRVGKNIHYLGGRCEGAGKAGLCDSCNFSCPEIPKKRLEEKIVFPGISKKAWAIGIDAGSRQIKAALLWGKTIRHTYSETTTADLRGQTDKILNNLRDYLPGNPPFYLTFTGSGGRYLSRQFSGGETLYETEILCHYRAANELFPDVGTVIDVGGNDSKIIIASKASLDFAMNDRCAAGTGSFLEQLARRFNLTLGEASLLALESKSPTRIGSRCAVLAETDIVHKMRSGAPVKDLLLGACYALAKTFISDTMHGKTLVLPVVFQGGAFLNRALLRSFIELLDLRDGDFYIAKDKGHLVGAGAIGAAIYALDAKKPLSGSILHQTKPSTLVGAGI